MYNSYGAAAWTGLGTTDSTGTVQFSYKQATELKTQVTTFTITAAASLAGYPSATGQAKFIFTYTGALLVNAVSVRKDRTDKHR